jgi:hypothetical protein
MGREEPTNPKIADFRCYMNDEEDHRQHCHPPKSKYTPLETRSVIIKVTLHTMRAPKIYRVLQFPAGRPFHTLQKALQALQAAFGWTNSHTYDFSARDASIGRRTRRHKLFVSLINPDIEPESY